MDFASIYIVVLVSAVMYSVSCVWHIVHIVQYWKYPASLTKPRKYFPIIMLCQGCLNKGGTICCHRDMVLLIMWLWQIDCCCWPVWWWIMLGVASWTSIWLWLGLKRQANTVSTELQDMAHNTNVNNTLMPSIPIFSVTLNWYLSWNSPDGLHSVLFHHGHLALPHVYSRHHFLHLSNYASLRVHDRVSLHRHDAILLCMYVDLTSYSHFFARRSYRCRSNIHSTQNLVIPQDRKLSLSKIFVDARPQCISQIIRGLNFRGSASSPYARNIAILNLF